MRQKRIKLFLLVAAFFFGALSSFAQTEAERDSIAYEQYLKEKIQKERKKMVREWEFKKARGGWTYGPEYNFILPFGGLIGKHEFDFHNSISFSAGYRFNSLFYLGASLGVSSYVYAYYPLKQFPYTPGSTKRQFDHELLIPVTISPRLYVYTGKWSPFIQIDACLAFSTSGGLFLLPTLPLGVEYNVKGRQALILALCPGASIYGYHRSGDFILGLKVGYMF